MADIHWIPDAAGGTLFDLSSANHIHLSSESIPWLISAILSVDSAAAPVRGPSGCVENAGQGSPNAPTDCHVYASCCARAARAEEMMFRVADRLAICAAILGKLAEKRSRHTEIYEEGQS